MILKSIQLKNFGSCKNVSFKFPLGISAFAGKNGAGKSTAVRDSVLYSLYGNARTTALKNIGHGGLIAKGHSEFNIALSFEINADKYEVSRSFNNISNAKKIDITVNNKKENGLKTDIQKYINESIGLDYDVFNYTTLITPESKCILEMKNTERRQFFYSLLKLDKFDKINELASKKNNTLEKDKISYQSLLTKNMMNLNNSIKDLEMLNKEYILISKILSNEKEIIDYNNSKQTIEYIQKELNRFSKDLELKDNIHFISELNKNKQLLMDYHNKHSIAKNKEIEINKQIKEYSKLTNGDCPTCFQAIDKDIINKIISSLNIEKQSLVFYTNDILNINKELSQLEINIKNVDQNNALYYKKLELETKLSSLQLPNVSQDLNNLTIQDIINAKSLKQKIDHIKLQIDQYQKENKIYNTKILEINTKQKSLSNIINFSSEIPNVIINDILETLIIKSNEFFELINNEEQRIELIIQDNEVFINNNEQQLHYLQCSTGEQVRINLIIRIALNTILCNILKKKKVDFILIDEGGISNVDEKSAVEIMGILNSLIENGIVKQILFITHSLFLLEHCDNVFKVEKTDKGTIIKQE